jgi:3-hydroxy-9,10-secoandrosta-1,3,5(10)-triene-9,17-dione monooxygenase reductase component
MQVRGWALGSAAVTAIDPMDYRRTLGSYPTGVVIITGAADDGPVGLAIGSFASVSLDPPLVGFLPDKGSSSWPKISETGSFCVNILAADQLEVCRTMASKGADKYASVVWRTAATGSPVLDGVLAWIDCTIERVDEAGDHWFVLGRVAEMAVERDDVGPLLFFRGAYGDFSALPG